MSEIKKTPSIGKQVKDRRSALGLSQRELAKLAQTTAAAVSHIERDQRQPSADLLKRLADALECSMDSLLGGKPESKAEGLYVDRVTHAMKSMPMKVQEQVANYCAFLRSQSQRNPSNERIKENPK